MSTTVLEAIATPPSAESGPGLLGGPELNAGAWRAEERAAAWRKFAELPLAGRGDEAWRFTSAKALDPSDFSAPQAVPDRLAEELIERSYGLDHTAGRMVFANDRLLERKVRSDALQQRGVIWLPIEDAEREHGELFRQHFLQEEAQLGGRRLAALHEAWLRTGMFLYVPRNVEIDLPVESFWWLTGERGSCFPHTLIVAEENSKVTVVDYFQSADPHALGFACGVNDLRAAAGARVTYVNVQRWNGSTRALQINSTVVGRDAAAMSLTANFGAAYARSESVSHLRGSGGRSDMLSVSTVDAAREVDQRTLQIHEVPHTASELLYKNALFDQARTIFAGLIRVAPGAHFTDAYQKVRNMLLSDEAESNSAPGLEIEADNVRCTHGATSGQIEEEELFYLLSRGIPRLAAQRLIVHGFLHEVLDRIPEEAIQVQLRAMLERQIG